MSITNNKTDIQKIIDAKDIVHNEILKILEEIAHNDHKIMKGGSKSLNIDNINIIGKYELIENHSSQLDRLNKIHMKNMNL
jgi:hypothetical protein